MTNTGPSSSFNLKSIVTAGTWLVLGLLLGIWLGAWQERVRHGWQNLSDAVGRDFFIGMHADRQYCNAEYEAAHEALLDWLSQLEASKPIDGQYRDPMMNPKAIALDKMLALARLAVLEERRGQDAPAKEYWQRAEREAESADWTDSSEAHIRTALDKIDYCGARRTAP